MTDLRAVVAEAYVKRSEADLEELEGIKQRWAGYIHTAIVTRDEHAEVYAPKPRYAKALVEWIESAGLQVREDSTYWYISGWED